MHAVNKHILVYSLEFLIVLLTASLVQAEFDAAECGKTKGCVRAPKECTSNEDCKISFSYRVDGDKLEMEIFGKPPIEEDAYIAVGFSNDTRMGNDLVVFCARDNGEVFAGVAIHGQRTKVEVLDSKGVQEQLSASQQDGTYYCKVSQVRKRSDDDMYSLDKSYHILLATGPYNNGSWKTHGKSAFIMPETSLTSLSGPGGAGSADAVEKKNTRIAFQGMVLVIVMATAAFQIWM